ncbi:hypothetical protein, partial [Methanomethylophilus alvi]|uniref:hypothetical protein n=1 Tax=Methanomethylophilus alvi TaxID=1291540 RepID=UPI0037DD47AE
AKKTGTFIGLRVETLLFRLCISGCGRRFYENEVKLSSRRPNFDRIKIEGYGIKIYPKQVQR